MNSCFNFLSITQYNKYIINLTKYEYEKIKKCIFHLKLKYDKDLLNLYSLEKINSKKFSFINQKNFILKHKKLLLNIIKDVLKMYKEELKNLEVVFLSGSFARGTNKMSSDIDLHFFYKTEDYNYIYEEVVCYIISRVVNKSRDCIDPTFIFNIQNENKKLITNKMNRDKLNVILRFGNKQIKYSYKYGKKRRFYLQYVNKRSIYSLFEYLNKNLIVNEEWVHCFEIIKGKEIFNKLYDKLYKQEKNIVNSVYIKRKINELKEIINKDNEVVLLDTISHYKDYYQSKTFEWIYKYISIIRFNLIKNNRNIRFLNLLDLYDNLEDKSIFYKIYEYMWNLEKLTIYCYENNINYGLHNHEKINYPVKEIDDKLKELKKMILSDLERLGELI